jgi:hypothetical protein
MDSSMNSSGNMNNANADDDQNPKGTAKSGSMHKGAHKSAHKTTKTKSTDNKSGKPDSQ